jgi:hypothetical protein
MLHVLHVVGRWRGLLLPQRFESKEKRDRNETEAHGAPQSSCGFHMQ